MDQDTTLFELVKGTTPAYIVLAEDEQPGVMAAALDLQRDITKISGVTPNIVHSLNQAGPHCVVIGSADNPKGKSLLESVGMKVNDLEGKWEVFKYQILDNVKGKEKVLAIAGSNLRGTIFGIYDFEHKHLGVDPLWFWADNEPPRQGQLVFDSSINYNSLKEPTWKYRGWTLNDHPQLIEWMQTGIVQRARYGRYMFAIHPEVFDRIYEAALRLKMNMFTWYFIDIDWKPDWQQLERQVDRGLFLTQHQMEGLGADAGFWDHYWDNHNPEGKPDQFSYIKYPEKFKEFWSYYITRLSEFSPNVVWELNQRGWADAQYYDPALPNGGTRKQRGQLVSEIITEQAKLVRKIDPNPDLEMMTTLYHEMGDYYDSGWINLPKDVTTGFADDGMNGMSYSDKFWTEKRDPNRKYGQYFHTNYFGGGPQIAKATPLDTYIKVNMDAMYERGDTQHMLLAMNVLRPQQMELRGIAEMLWDYPGFDYEEYLLKYCREEFGEEASARVANLYREYYDKYPHKMRNDGYKEYPYYYKVMESLFNTIANLINIEAGSTDGLIFDKYYNREKYQEGIVEMKKVLDHAWEIRPSIPDHRKYFFDYEFIDAIRLIRGIYKLTVNTEDAINYLKEGNRSAALSSLNDAKHLVDEMYDAFENQKSTDKWKYWFRSGTNKDFYLLYNMYQKARLSLEVETMNAVTEISPQRRPYRGNVVMHDVTKAGDAVYEAQGDRLNRSQWDGAKYSIIDFPLTKAFQITGVQGLYGKEKWLEIGTDYGSHYGFNLRSKAKVYVAYQKGEDLTWLKDMGFKPTGQSMTVGEWGWPYRYQNRPSDSLYVLQLYAKDFESGPVVLGKNPESKDLLPYIVFVQPSLIMYENFRDTEIGEQPSNWMIEESTGRAEVVDIVEYDGEMRPTVFDITTVPRYQTLDLRGLKLESSTEEGCGAKYFFEEMVNGDFVLDVRLKTGQIDHLSEIILLNQDEKPNTSIQFDNRGKIVMLSPDGKKVELSSYRANEWYNIKLRVQSSRGKFWVEVQDGDLQQSKSEIMNFNPRKGGMKGIQLNHSKGRDGAWILYNGLSGYVE
ncbi:hypothetical protein GCM10025777_05750 [Membranihabitans marinus]